MTFHSRELCLQVTRLRKLLQNIWAIINVRGLLRKKIVYMPKFSSLRVKTFSIAEWFFFWNIVKKEIIMFGTFLSRVQCKNISYVYKRFQLVKVCAISITKNLLQLQLSEVFEQEIDPVMQSMGYCCGRKYTFNPQVLCCYGKQLCTIPRDATYYSYQNRYICRFLFFFKIDSH